MKNPYFVFILLGIVVFNGIFFFTKDETVIGSIWYAFGFINFAFLSNVLLPLFYKKNDPKIFRDTLFLCAGLYLFLELIIGITSICLHDGAAWQFWVQVSLVVLYLFSLLLNIVCNKNSRESL